MNNPRCVSRKKISLFLPSGDNLKPRWNSFGVSRQKLAKPL
jgi:hypothetical protein